ncbi:MAG: hypothetical protein AAF417_21915, partial [Pseudomonadota bacterium]
YLKGPQLRAMQRKREYTGRRYSEDEIAGADRVVRLELMLRRKWFEDRPWYNVTSDCLLAEFFSYFDRMLGTMEVTDVSALLARCIDSAPTEGQGRAAYATWLLIRSHGYEPARQVKTKSTWYRDIKVLKAAGLGTADLRGGVVVPFRRRAVSIQQVNSWQQLLASKTY